MTIIVRLDSFGAETKTSISVARGIAAPRVETSASARLKSLHARFNMNTESTIHSFRRSQPTTTWPLCIRSSTEMDARRAPLKR